MASPAHEVSLRDIMSEELARKLAEDDERYAPASASPAAAHDDALADMDDTSGDLELAMRLQHEYEAGGAAAEGTFDTDYALALMLQEEERGIAPARRQAAASTKVVVGQRTTAASGEAHMPRRYGHADAEDVSDDEDYDHEAALRREEDDEARQEELRAVTMNRGSQPTSTGSSPQLTGMVGPGPSRRASGGARHRLRAGDATKHDPHLTGLRNAADLAQRHPEMGDMADGEVCIPTAAFNSLKLHLQSQKTKGFDAHGRVAREEHATQEMVLDARTRTIIFKWINGGHLDELRGVVKMGKEASVFHAIGPDLPIIVDAEAQLVSGFGTGEQRQAVHEMSADKMDDLAVRALQRVEEAMLRGARGDRAVKIFKTTLNEFRNRVDYMEGDFRYHGQRLHTRDTRKLIRLWADKEVKNLHRIHRAGIPSPRPLLLKDHVLLMTFIGRKGWPAPQLKDVELTTQQWMDAYVQTVEMLHNLLHVCQLVHADFSEYNLLYHRGLVWVVDVGQAVQALHPRAMEFLRKDCENATSFFARKLTGRTGPGTEAAGAEDASGAAADAGATSVAASAAGADALRPLLVLNAEELLALVRDATIARADLRAAVLERLGWEGVVVAADADAADPAPAAATAPAGAAHAE